MTRLDSPRLNQDLDDGRGSTPRRRLAFANPLRAGIFRPRNRAARIDPNVWSGRASQEDSSRCRTAVLHQCIRPLIGACRAPGHYGYQRACDVITGQASIGPFGSPVFACAGKTDPPSLRCLSQTSAGKAGGYVIACSLSRTVPLFAPKTVPSSRPAQRRSRRAQGRSRSVVALTSQLAYRRQAAP